MRGETVGILGGGQLAQMLAVDAIRLGLKPIILATSPKDCALRIVGKDQYRLGINKKNLDWLAKQVKVISLESEFVDIGLLRSSRAERKILPSLKSLELCQSKLSQKKFLKKNSIPTLPFESFKSLRDIRTCGKSCVIKKARLGYDGKGVYKISNLNDVALKALLLNGDFEGYIEPVADFKAELSVVIARSKNGKIQAFDVVQTWQAQGVCNETVYPAKFSSSIKAKALRIARDVIKKAGGVGVFGVEMFLLKNGDVVVNEIAPRVHNTGHWTLDGSSVSQFEQHWNALLNRPLAKPQYAKSCAMVNVLGRFRKELGPDFDPLPRVGKIVAQLYWYGKQGQAQGRKLGHINAVAQSPLGALKQARQLRKVLKI